MLNKQFEEPSETDWSVFILKANLENTYWNYIGVVTIQLNFELCFAFRNACENVSTHNAQHVLCLPYVYIYVAQITVHGKFMFISPQAISLMINYLHEIAYFMLTLEFDRISIFLTRLLPQCSTVDWHTTFRPNSLSSSFYIFLLLLF